MKKKIINLITGKILNNGNFIKLEKKEQKFYNFIIKVIDTQLDKPKQTGRRKPP